MFEFGWDQAAGLRASTATPAVVMPVACSARPAAAYELLCSLAAQLGALGRDAAIVDASAIETDQGSPRSGVHLGLLHTLKDPLISGLGAPDPSAEWLVMPGALGMQALQQTARAAGAAVAVSRLLAPFAAGTVVLLYAPANSLSALFAGLQVPVMVPVLAQPQATIDAYGSIKVLHAAGLTPVLAPLASPIEEAQAPLAQVVRSVCECSQRYLAYTVEQWASDSWGQRVQEAAMAAPWPPGTQPAPLSPEPVDFYGRAIVPPTRWS